MKLSHILEILGTLIILVGVWHFSPSLAIILGGSIIILAAQINLKGGER